MIARIALCIILLPTSLAQAQMIPALHPSSGLYATAAPWGVERDGLRTSGPHSEAAAMTAANVFETIPLRQRSGSKGPATRPADLIQRVMPAFRLGNSDLKIPDVQEIIFFAETRAVRIRLHLKAAGEPLSKAWLAQLRRYFDYLDRDGDGQLNAFEADFVFSSRSVQQLLQFGGANINPNEPGRLLVDFDRDGDGRISFDEFAAYYAAAAPLLVRVQPMVNRDNFGDALTDEFFKLLDRDGDGKLSKAELLEAEKLLSLLDQNEDECLTALELVPNLFSRGRTSPAVVGVPVNPSPAQSTQALQIFRAGSVPDNLFEQLLIRYDKDKNLRLTKAESGFDEATFARLDKNGDKELSITELMAWKDLPPDLEFDLTVGVQQAGGRIKLLAGADGKPRPLDGSVQVTGNEKAVVQVGKQRIDVGSMGSPNYTVFAARNFLPIFEQADADNKGYIVEKKLIGPQYQFLRIVFDIADRNNDGRLTRQEFLDYFELQQSFATLPVVVSHITQTPSLFALLDANGDGRLSLRELRQAWSRLKELEPGSGDFITRSALKPQATIRVSRADQAFQAAVGTNYNPVPQTPSKGPLWFRKMDRNGDGDISRSEFPGRPEDFDRLDLDHDGLISLEEAEAAEKQFRQVKSEKK